MEGLVDFGGDPEEQPVDEPEYKWPLLHRRILKRMFGKVPLDNGASQAFQTVGAELALTQISPNLLDLRGIPSFRIIRKGVADRISVTTGKNTPPQDVQVFPWLPTERHAGFSDVIFEAFCFNTFAPIHLIIIPGFAQDFIFHRFIPIKIAEFPGLRLPCP